MGSRVACSQVLRTRGKQEDLFGSCYSNAEGDGAVPEEAGGDSKGLPMPLEEEMDEVMQGFVVGLEGLWAGKIQREGAMERGGLGSQASCGCFLYIAEGKG